MFYELRQLTAPIGFEEFARINKLKLVVSERPIGYGLPRYHAAFEYVEILDGYVLIGAYGNGETPEKAIKDYMKRIAGCKLIYRAMIVEERKEMQTPNEWGE